MTLQYEVIPWDHMGFGVLDPALPPVASLEEAARLLRGPADCILAIDEDGSRRPLTEYEETLLFKK